MSTAPSYLYTYLKSYFHEVLANPTDAPSSFEGLDGILGLGPSIAADTRALINSSAGDPPLDRIFRQNMSTPNILTVLLSRASDTDVFAEARSPQNSLLSIGEVLEGFESIAYTPKLYAAIDLLGSSHWQTTLDSNGIIGPDGQRINTPTSASNVTIGNFTDTTVGGKDQFRVVFDTGFTVPQVCIVDLRKRERELTINIPQATPSCR